MTMYRQIIIIHDKNSKSKNLPIYKIFEVYSKPFTKNERKNNNIEYAVYCNEGFIDCLHYIFKDKYIHRPDIGRDYYYGDINEIIKDVNKLNTKIQYKSML